MSGQAPDTLRVIADTLQRIEALLAASAHRWRAPGEAAGADLVELLPTVWQMNAGAIWQVADLREAGLLDKTQTASVGRALGLLADAGGRLGPFIVSRVDDLQGHRRGCGWTLRRL